MAVISSASPRVLLMVTGGIAAYKSCILARLLQQAGFSVRVAMTSAATRFVTPLTLQVLTGQAVATDLWGEGQSKPLDHIDYASWADITVVAPATANILAKAAAGIADDMVSTLLLALDGPVIMAPAMNDRMWSHAATQANVQTLGDRDVTMVGPGSGHLACGTTAPGRMSEPEEILEVVRAMANDLALKSTPVAVALPPAVDSWRGRKVVVTAGPTREAIDSVRYVANHSTGAMGYALAAEAVLRGAEVTLISGPVSLVAPRGLAQFHPVETATEMAEAVAAALAGSPDWLIMAAAVADYAPEDLALGKLKKEELGPSWSLRLKRNPDILGEVVPAHAPAGLKVVGFALETSQVQERALAKLRAKHMDYIVANDPTAEGSGFGAVPHQVMLLGPEGIIWQSESLPKVELAVHLLRKLAEDQTS